MPKKTDEAMEARVRRAFDISSDINDVVSEIVEAGGEVTEPQLEALNSLRLEFAEKAMSICHVRSKLTDQAEYWKRCKQYADERLKACERTTKWLSEYLCSCMKQADCPSIKGEGMFTVSVVKGKESVVVDDVQLLPFGSFELVRKPNAKAIKEAFDRGEEVPGAHIELGKDYVMIRQGRTANEDSIIDIQK